MESAARFISSLRHGLAEPVEELVRVAFGLLRQSLPLYQVCNRRQSMSACLINPCSKS